MFTLVNTKQRAATGGSGSKSRRVIPVLSIPLRSLRRRSPIASQHSQKREPKWRRRTHGITAPELRKAVEALPDVVYSTKAHTPHSDHPSLTPPGVLPYLRTHHDTDALLWLDENKQPVTESPVRVVRAAACPPETPALPRRASHHELVARSVELILEEGHNRPEPLQAVPRTNTPSRPRWPLWRHRHSLWHLQRCRRNRSPQNAL
jgi:hypothetical protein